MPNPKPQLTLYAHPLASYCWKVLIALYETQTEFHFERVDGPPKAHPLLSVLWPMGKMPVLCDNARNIATPETTIIIEYLQAHYPGTVSLIPGDFTAALKVRLWDRFFDLYVQTPMQKLVSDHMKEKHCKDATGVAEARAQLDTAYQMLEGRLVDQTWVADEAFSLADCAAAPALFYAEAAHPFSNSHPKLAHYFHRLTARMSVRRTIREAQPFFRLFPFADALDPRFLRSDL